jgi:hypothetical protein
MSVDEFYSLKLALLVQITAALVVFGVVSSFAPGLFLKEGFGWAFGALLLGYIALTTSAMQRKILQVHEWLKQRRAK